jgi:outer membrane protein OmpA-like peptidoglycan-associated protein
MKNKLILFGFLLIIFHKSYSQTSDSVAIKNQKQIQELKNRLNKLDKENSAEALIEKLEKLVLQQQDSIVKLNYLLSKKSSYIGVQLDYAQNCACDLVFYDMNNPKINYSESKEVANIVGKIKGNSKLKIVGHADKTGIESRNQKLSEQRAKLFLEYLVSQNLISKENISIEWHGSSKPITGLSEDKQYLNRRVEVYFE